METHTDRLILINREELLNINLAELPADFYLKPTLRWRLLAGKAGKYPISLSYLCQGMSWEVTYNAVWNASENRLDVSSWVTLKNETGKAYHDTVLKLIAGDVNKMRDPLMRQKQAYEIVASAVEFEEKSFHDFYLYTLNEPVSISNNQTKQIKLFPTTSVTARSRYEYLTYSNNITSQIIFINSEKEGFGKALPQGVFKIYLLDASDDNLEFIGEDRIQHTPRDERVSINTGSAFDLVGETVVVNQTREGKNIQIRDMKVILKNRSDNTKTVTVTHHLDGFGTILAESIRSKKIDANTVEFEKELEANEVYELTWTEKIVY
ncbi:MAG: hypothetical protein JW996_01875 [Candidatus Cloacimonetes bacterium]|nr:hypothetical protein [Candidatus Cloacimonadota bacterium]